MDERDEAFYENVGSSIDSWVRVAVEGLSDQTAVSPSARPAFAQVGAALDTPERRDAFEAVVRDTLIGLAHSIMVTLDGGGAYSDRLGSPQLLHGDGQPFASGLHDWLFEHLGRTGRLLDD
jgi:hypothetical protein